MIELVKIFMPDEVVTLKDGSSNNFQNRLSVDVLPLSFGRNSEEIKLFKFTKTLTGSVANFILLLTSKDLVHVYTVDYKPSHSGIILIPQVLGIWPTIFS